MHRRPNLRGAFPTSADEYTQPVERLLQLRRADMDEEWGKLEEGWASHNERMVRFGLAPRTDGEDVFKVNVGGLNVTVSWHLLAGAEGFKESVLGGLLEGVWAKGRIPRDADDRIVLDESPVCIRHIIDQTTLRAIGRASSATVGLPERSALSAVATDEVPCLICTAHVMGLPGSVLAHHQKYVNMNGGSTVLEPFEIAPLGAKIREWVGSSTDQMTLIYRATRDGFDTTSFKPRCNEDSPHTVSLLRVTSGKGNDADSIVGGYSVMPWGSCVESKQTITAGTFLFMLKDGSATGRDPSEPIKWNPYPKGVGITFKIKNNCPGARVCGNDLFTWLDETRGGCVLKTGRETFDVEKDSPFLALNLKKVVEVEVYRFSTPAPPATTPPSATKPSRDSLTDAEAHDIDYFGRSTAISLTEERVVLDRAVKDMEAAGARVSAAVDSLETVYGPSVAAGEQDTVVELNVRGTRMTTLRSTLQACPRSALAAMFNDDRWPATDKDKDEHGRRLIDCNPICFSKILDVLRMRKRVSWSRGGARGKQDDDGDEEEEEEQEDGGEEKDKGGKEEEGQADKEKEDGEEKEGVGKGAEVSSNRGSGAVFIKQADVEAFGETVNLYFPGSESFIMDLVQSV